VELAIGILGRLILPVLSIAAAVFIFLMALLIYGAYCLKRDEARLAVAEKKKEESEAELVKVDKKLKELVSQYKVNMEKRKRGEK